MDPESFLSNFRGSYQSYHTSYHNMGKNIQHVDKVFAKLDKRKESGKMPNSFYYEIIFMSNFWESLHCEITSFKDF